MRFKLYFFSQNDFIMDHSLDIYPLWEDREKVQEMYDL